MFIYNVFNNMPGCCYLCTYYSNKMIDSFCYIYYSSIIYCLLKFILSSSNLVIRQINRARLTYCERSWLLLRIAVLINGPYLL